MSTQTNMDLIYIMRIIPVWLLVLMLSVWPNIADAQDSQNTLGLGSWTDWGVWGPCSTTCGAGRRSRSRSCIYRDLSDTRGQDPCLGPSVETRFCINSFCPATTSPTIITTSSTASSTKFSTTSSTKSTNQSLTPHTTVDHLMEAFCANKDSVVCGTDLDPICDSDKTIHLNRCEFSKDVCNNRNLVLMNIEFCAGGITLAPITPPPLCKASRWSKWFNRDTPNSGAGDIERLTPTEMFLFCSYGQIDGVECQTVDGVQHYNTGELNYCSLNAGFECMNNDNAPLTCSDYEIRYHCQCGDNPNSTTTATTTAATTTTTTTTTTTSTKPTTHNQVAHTTVDRILVAFCSSKDVITCAHDMSSPICGSDKKSYLNKCEFSKAFCDNRNLVTMSQDFCKGKHK